MRTHYLTRFVRSPIASGHGQLECKCDHDMPRSMFRFRGFRNVGDGVSNSSNDLSPCKCERTDLLTVLRDQGAPVGTLVIARQWDESARPGGMKENREDQTEAARFVSPTRIGGITGPCSSSWPF